MLLFLEMKIGVRDAEQHRRPICTRGEVSVTLRRKRERETPKECRTLKWYVCICVWVREREKRERCECATKGNGMETGWCDVGEPWIGRSK